jgi:hypothetical protein
MFDRRQLERPPLDSSERRHSFAACSRLDHTLKGDHMKVVRIFVMALAVLLPASWTIAKAADEPAGADTKTETKTTKKVKKSKKSDGSGETKTETKTDTDSKTDKK